MVVDACGLIGMFKMHKRFVADQSYADVVAGYGKIDAIKRCVGCKVRKDLRCQIGCYVQVIVVVGKARYITIGNRFALVLAKKRGSALVLIDVLHVGGY